MPVNPKEGKLLYHLTALENLESIFKKGLIPRNYVDFDIIDIADEEILKSREKFNLHDNVLFHFFGGTPFSGAAQKAFQDIDFVYLTISRTLARQNKFKIIPSHPLHYIGEPLDWDEGIANIDWDLMSSRNYFDNECKEVCMAEAIFEGKIPANIFNNIFVKDEKTENLVLKLLQKYDLHIRVNVISTFFI